MKHTTIRILIIIFLGYGILSAAVTVSNVSELVQAVNAANSGGDKVILLNDGNYVLNQMLWISADHVTVRSVSGDRGKVFIRGRGMTGSVSHIFNVAGTGFTAKDMTLGWVANHAIQIHGNNNSSDTVLSNLHIIDTFEQMVKISYDSDLPNRSRNGLMENCLLEYSAGIGPQWYIGGIDGHRCENWVVRNNIFKHIISPDADLAEHAIHFWSDSSGTLVENNIIINCDRGIGFGLGSRGHIGGTIRNNFIYHGNLHTATADVGIGLENSNGTNVYNNTVYFVNNYPNAIEYRFSGTHSGLIANNLTNRLIRSRDGGTATLSNNYTGAQAHWFVNPAVGNLHLLSAVSGIVDSGVDVNGLSSDIDGEPRPAGAVDIGADEFGSSPGFLQLLSPDGGENWGLNSMRFIRWNASGLSNGLKMTLWQNSSFVGLIAKNCGPQSGQISWQVGSCSDSNGHPFVVSPGSGFQVKVKEKGSSVSVISTSHFNIHGASSLILSTPNGGERIQSGRAIDILWNSNGLSGNIKLSLWQDGTQIGTISPRTAAAAGRFLWQAGDVVGGSVQSGTGYIVKIKEKGGVLSDTSDAPFSMVHLELLSPLGTENIVNGQAVAIRWSHGGIGNPLKISLWRNRSSVRVIRSSVSAGTGQIQWIPNETAGSGYVIKIKEKGSTVADICEQTFSIVDPN